MQVYKKKIISPLLLEKLFVAIKHNINSDLQLMVLRSAGFNILLCFFIPFFLINYKRDFMDTIFLCDVNDR